MASNLIASGETGAADASADINVVAGAPVTVCLKDARNTARVIIEKKDDAAAWQPTGSSLDAAGPTRTLVGAGVYRLRRVAGYCGAFRD